MASEQIYLPCVFGVSHPDADTDCDADADSHCDAESLYNDAFDEGLETNRDGVLFTRHQGGIDVYHWHREGFTLTEGCERLAVGEAFENQAYRYGPAAFGIQFHPEVTRLMMHRWSVSGAHRFVLKGAQHGSEHLAGNLLHDAAVKQWLGSFLDRWLTGALRSEPVAAAA